MTRYTPPRSKVIRRIQGRRSTGIPGCVDNRHSAKILQHNAPPSVLTVQRHQKPRHRTGRRRPTWEKELFFMERRLARLGIHGAAAAKALREFSEATAEVRRVMMTGTTWLRDLPGRSA